MEKQRPEKLAKLRPSSTLCAEEERQIAARLLSPTLFWLLDLFPYADVRDITVAEQSLLLLSVLFKNSLELCGVTHDFFYYCHNLISEEI